MQSPEQQSYIFIPGLQQKISSATTFSGSQQVKFKQVPEGAFIYLEGIKTDDIDTIIQLNAF